MLRTISLLIADNLPMIQQLLTEAARAAKLPLRLSTTDNGRDCLTLLNGANIDLAFIDVHMPELSGTEAFWSARKQGIKTFVTLMSNPPAEEAVAMAMKLQAYEFLFKPFAVHDALAIIKTYARISGRTNVLVVDDSSAVRQIIHKIVRGSVFNCDITEAASGETALALCMTSEFDVVFLDCNMPGTGGLNTMKRLLAMEPQLKIVMISSERDAETEKAALEAGAAAFLHKPFGSDDVDRVLHAAFGLRSPNLKVAGSAASFDVAIEGSTIRLAHKTSGHVFEYLWCEKPPYLRNRIVHEAPSGGIEPTRVAAVAEVAALQQLRTARLLAAA